MCDDRFSHPPFKRIWYQAWSRTECPGAEARSDAVAGGECCVVDTGKPRSAAAEAGARSSDFFSILSACPGLSRRLFSTRPATPHVDGALPRAAFPRNATSPGDETVKSRSRPLLLAASAAVAAG